VRLNKHAPSMVVFEKIKKEAKLWTAGAKGLREPWPRVANPYICLVCKTKLNSNFILFTQDS
jgi:hypothetical protein